MSVTSAQKDNNIIPANKEQWVWHIVTVSFLLFGKSHMRFKVIQSDGDTCLVSIWSSVSEKKKKKKKHKLILALFFLFSTCMCVYVCVSVCVCVRVYVFPPHQQLLQWLLKVRKTKPKSCAQFKTDKSYVCLLCVLGAENFVQNLITFKLYMNIYILLFFCVLFVVKLSF